MHTPQNLPATPEALILDAQGVAKRLGMTVYQVRWLRRRKRISFIKAGSRVVRFWWPQVVEDLRRFEIKAVGRLD